MSAAPIAPRHRTDRAARRGLVVASIQPAQAEFGHLEMATRADLVRVLTHEIVNSLTPVTSLAHSAAGVVGQAAVRNPALTDARDAVTTLAARADRIGRFVESYRDFAFSPELRHRRFAAADWAAGIVALARADAKVPATVELAIEPAAVRLDGDAYLLPQVALNLIRNAALAGAGRVALRIAVRRAGRVALEVADDGPGIPPDQREDVFMLFYTTRRDGSGVGLSFARQVVLAHSGSIVAGESDWEGASIPRAVLSVNGGASSRQRQLIVTKARQNRNSRTISVRWAAASTISG